MGICSTKEADDNDFIVTSSEEDDDSEDLSDSIGTHVVVPTHFRALLVACMLCADALVSVVIMYLHLCLYEF